MMVLCSRHGRQDAGERTTGETETGGVIPPVCVTPLAGAGQINPRAARIPVTGVQAGGSLHGNDSSDATSTTSRGATGGGVRSATLAARYSSRQARSEGWN